MTDAVCIAAIAVLSNAVTGYFAYLASKQAKETLTVAKQTEQNTNHLKDELVALTRKDATAVGHLEGVREEKARQEGV